MSIPGNTVSVDSALDKHDGYWFILADKTKGCTSHIFPLRRMDESFMLIWLHSTPTS